MIKVDLRMILFSRNKLSLFLELGHVQMNNDHDLYHVSLTFIYLAVINHNFNAMVINLWVGQLILWKWSSLYYWLLMINLLLTENLLLGRVKFWLLSVTYVNTYGSWICAVSVKSVHCVIWSHDLNDQMRCQNVCNKMVFKFLTNFGQ